MAGSDGAGPGSPARCRVRASSVGSHNPCAKDLTFPKTPVGHILLLSPLHRGGK